MARANKPNPMKAGTGNMRHALGRLQGMDDLAYMVPGLSTAKFGADMIGDIEQGNYGDAATSAGMAALGLLPLGSMVAGAGKNALKWTDKLGESPKLFSKFTDKMNDAAKYLDRLGLPDTKEGRAAAQAIMNDAERVYQRTPEKGKKSFIADWQGEYPNPKSPTGKNNPFDIVDYEMPPKTIWDQKTGNLPYPSKKPKIAVDRYNETGVGPFSPTMISTTSGKTINEVTPAFGSLIPQGPNDLQFIKAAKDRGLSTKEIASRMGATESAIKKVLGR